MKVPRLEPIAPRVWLLRGGLAALRPRIVGVGHLGPMTGPDVAAELERAAAS